MSGRRVKDQPDALWTEVCSKVRLVDKQKREVEQILHTIRKDREKFDREPFLKPSDKIRKLYNDALSALQKEESAISHAQERLTILISIIESSATEIDRKKIDFTAPLPIMKTKPLPPLCGPTPPPENFQFPNGALVAAKTSPKEAEWILAIVVRKINEKGKYEVVDYDDEVPSTSPAKKNYLLGGKSLIMLPTSLPDPKMKAEFAEKLQVLALYPQTTCFYRATVIQPPSKSKNGDYLVMFEEEEEQGGEIPQFYISPRLVLSLPKPKKKD